jgi:hydroxymethylbilane synthase
MNIVKSLTIATRESALALWQAHHVADLVRTQFPTCTVNLLPMTTKGDQILDRPLAAIGGKGLFLKELEVAMLEGRADLAVHSLKDVPTQLDPGFQLAAVLPREDPSDALVSNTYHSIDALPVGARVGSSSKRRALQLKLLRPDLQIQDLRGNVQTRLRKLDEDHYDAIVLATAGLKRLDLDARISCTLPQLIPAAGQGALGLECLSGNAELVLMLQRLACAYTTATTRAERAFADALGGSCQVPIAAYCVIVDLQLHLRGLVGEADGDQHWRGELRGSLDAPEALGQALAEQLLANGAKRLDRA